MGRSAAAAGTAVNPGRAEHLEATGAGAGGSAGRAIVAIALATLAFAGALAGRHRIDVWSATAAAALASIALATWAGRASLLARLRPRLLPAVGGLAAGAALAAATHAGYRLLAGVFAALPGLAGALYRDLERAPGPFAAASPAVMLPLLLLVTLAEELVWRGLLVDLLRPHLPALATGVLATALYALPLVASGNLALVALGLLCGAVWTALRLATGGLVASWACHATWGMLVFAIRPLTVGG